jgi:hypothetical protein
LTVCIHFNRHVVNAEIAVVENETIERGLVAVCRHDVWDEAQERLLGRRSNGTDGVIVILPPDHVAYVPDRRFDLGREKSNAELACGSNWNGERFRLLFKEAFAEPKGGEVKREIEVEQ